MPKKLNIKDLAASQDLSRHPGGRSPLLHSGTMLELLCHPEFNSGSINGERSEHIEKSVLIDSGSESGMTYKTRHPERSEGGHSPLLHLDSTQDSSCPPLKEQREPQSVSDACAPVSLVYQAYECERPKSMISRRGLDEEEIAQGVDSYRTALAPLRDDIQI